ncbi:hypothetical protein [Legionella sp. 16cNR16C]|uniref:hypothetical protein n=1 Tax=Legionella sp. 16cNR16C TaxID=2905656 RepID=UPI001E52BA6D|nr:hypothetical protein [Legionella sp. 16cNR16C]MCE3044654.1 hypothetical protein [Legionella sp. 16cNR16C]
MTKELTRPSWYNDEFYNKSRTPEEWLYELWKRYQFNQDEIGLPNSIHTYSIKQQEKYFDEFIFDRQIDKFLSFFVKATPPEPIRYPSVSDIFIMYCSGRYAAKVRSKSFSIKVNPINPSLLEQMNYLKR